MGALRSLQVQQSVVANLSADLDQEAASSDEVLPHGLVSVISAQNALSFDRSGGGEPQLVPASMLQVCCTLAQTTIAHPGGLICLRICGAMSQSQVSSSQRRRLQWMATHCAACHGSGLRHLDCCRSRTKTGGG